MFMVNINGTLYQDFEANIPTNNRGLAYGDSVFETIKFNNNKPVFWEAHYFRLMASMRILRMEIPMHFTPEFLENEIVNLVQSFPNNAISYRVKITVYRDSDVF
jgi:branched-chain amino acid aminotransferase